MDVKQVFEALEREEQPPSTVDVGRAVAAGRAIRGRRRAALTGVSAAVTAVAVISTWAAQPWQGQRGDLAVAVPATISPSSTPTSSTPTSSTPASSTPTPRPAYKGFAEWKKRHPPKGRIASVPPLLMWLSDAPRKGEIFLCESGPNGSTCSGILPLAAGEYGRTEGKLRGENVWLGVAKDAVHGVTAVTGDGRELPGNLTRRMGAGLVLWAVEYPRGADVRRLVFTGAKGETLQRISS